MNRGIINFQRERYGNYADRSCMYEHAGDCRHA